MLSSDHARAGPGFRDPASDGLDHSHVETIMDRFGVRTKTEAVDLALRNLGGQPMTRSEALAMRGAHAIADVPDDRGPDQS